MALPASQSAVLTSVAHQYMGKTSGTYSTMRQLGGAFGVAVLVAVFAETGSYASAEAFSDGFGPAIAAGAALSLAGAGAGIALRGRHAASDGAAPQAVRASGAEAGG
jgi:hypothetical protein